MAAPRAAEEVQAGAGDERGRLAPVVGPDLDVVLARGHEGGGADPGQARRGVVGLVGVEVAEHALAAGRERVVVEETALEGAACLLVGQETAGEDAGKRQAQEAPQVFLAGGCSSVTNSSLEMSPAALAVA